MYAGGHLFSTLTISKVLEKLNILCNQVLACNYAFASHNQQHQQDDSPSHYEQYFTRFSTHSLRRLYTSNVFIYSLICDIDFIMVMW